MHFQKRTLARGDRRLRFNRPGASDATPGCLTKEAMIHLLAAITWRRLFNHTSRHSMRSVNVILVAASKVSIAKRKNTNVRTWMLFRGRAIGQRVVKASGLSKEVLDNNRLGDRLRCRWTRINRISARCLLRYVISVMLWPEFGPRRLAPDVLVNEIAGDQVVVGEAPSKSFYQASHSTSHRGCQSHTTVKTSV
jgi:hypothetical protein